MNDAEKGVMKYQMTKMASVGNHSLTRLNNEWSEFVDIRLKKIKDTHLKTESDKSEVF